MFSKACEYGIKAMIYLCERHEDLQKTGIKEIADKIQSPEAFTAKIMQKLSKLDFLDSVRGPGGGFFLSKPPEQISLAQIVEAIDGDDIFNGCSLGLQQCNSARPCPLHFEFVAIRDDLAKMLHNTNLGQLAASLKNGSTFLVR